MQDPCCPPGVAQHRGEGPILTTPKAARKSPALPMETRRVAPCILGQAALFLLTAAFKGNQPRVMASQVKSNCV